MDQTPVFIAIVASAYFLGSVPFGKLVGLSRGIDIQKKGSGNIGFANCLRELGWRPALIVLAGDIMKGLLPVLIAKNLEANSWQLAVVGVAAIAGHIFPVWLKFKGGKGIATGLGVTAAISPLLAVLSVLVYGFVFAFVRRSAPSSVAAACSLPLFCLVIAPAYCWLYTGLVLLAVWTHRSNISQVFKRADYA